MKAKHTLTATWAILALSSHLPANPSITNINVTPDQQAGTIVISYNISGITDSSATVQAKASINNGTTYSVTLQNATGALGAGITNGSGKQITWSAKKDLPYGGPFQMKIQLDAYEGGEDKPVIFNGLTKKEWRTLNISEHVGIGEKTCLFEITKMSSGYGDVKLIPSGKDYTVGPWAGGSGFYAFGVGSATFTNAGKEGFPYRVYVICRTSEDGEIKWFSSVDNLQVEIRLVSVLVST
jgi:hypothetical protein